MKQEEFSKELETLILKAKEGGLQDEEIQAAANQALPTGNVSATPLDWDRLIKGTVDLYFGVWDVEGLDEEHRKVLLLTKTVLGYRLTEIGHFIRNYGGVAQTFLHESMQKGLLTKSEVEIFGTFYPGDLIMGKLREMIYYSTQLRFAEPPSPSTASRYLDPNSVEFVTDWFRKVFYGDS